MNRFPIYFSETRRVDQIGRGAPQGSNSVDEQRLQARWHVSLRVTRDRCRLVVVVTRKRRQKGKARFCFFDRSPPPSPPRRRYPCKSMIGWQPSWQSTTGEVRIYAPSACIYPRRSSQRNAPFARIYADLILHPSCSLSYLKCSREVREKKSCRKEEFFLAEGDRSGDGGAGGSWGRKLEVHLHTWQTREGKKDFEKWSPVSLFVPSWTVLTIEKYRNRLLLQSFSRYFSRFYSSCKRAEGEWIFWREFIKY